jgi:hypothetical protein
LYDSRCRQERHRHIHNRQDTGTATSPRNACNVPLPDHSCQCYLPVFSQGIPYNYVQSQLHAQPIVITYPHFITHPTANWTVPIFPQYPQTRTVHLPNTPVQIVPPVIKPPLLYADKRRKL